MTATNQTNEAAYSRDEEISMLALGTVLLRWRRTIIGLGLAGLIVGIIAGVSRPRTYESSATFLPQGAESQTSGLAAAASQFGFRVPTSGSTWGPSIYVQLLRSRMLLEPIARDTVTVVEQNGRHIAVMDLLDVKPAAPSTRMDRAVRKLAGMVTANEVRAISAVEVTVATRWPSVSLALAERLVSGVNQFNLQTRKSQAAAERQFVEARALEAERALRDAEDRLQSFLQRNRVINPSSESGFQRDRMQREVTRLTQVYTSLLESLDDARIREVRDTPVITVISEPRIPIVGQARGTVRKGILGGIVGAAVGVLIALFAEGFSRVRRQSTDESREFFQLVREATPRFIRGRQH